MFASAVTTTPHQPETSASDDSAFCKMLMDIGSLLPQNYEIAYSLISDRRDFFADEGMISNFIGGVGKAISTVLAWLWQAITFIPKMLFRLGQYILTTIGSLLNNTKKVAQEVVRNVPSYDEIYRRWYTVASNEDLTEFRRIILEKMGNNTKYVNPFTFAPAFLNVVMLPVVKTLISEEAHKLSLDKVIKLMVDEMDASHFGGNTYYPCANGDTLSRLGRNTKVTLRKLLLNYFPGRDPNADSLIGAVGSPAAMKALLSELCRSLSHANVPQDKVLIYPSFGAIIYPVEPAAQIAIFETMPGGSLSAIKIQENFRDLANSSAFAGFQKRMTSYSESVSEFLTAMRPVFIMMPNPVTQSTYQATYATPKAKAFEKTFLEFIDIVKKCIDSEEDFTSIMKTKVVELRDFVRTSITTPEFLWFMRDFMTSYVGDLRMFATDVLKLAELKRNVIAGMSEYMTETVLYWQKSCTLSQEIMIGQINAAESKQGNTKPSTVPN